MSWGKLFTDVEHSLKALSARCKYGDIICKAICSKEIASYVAPNSRVFQLTKVGVPSYVARLLSVDENEQS